MGGKSTLLRSTCVAVIMAQLGCYVAASSAVVEPVDAIFTRIGEKGGGGSVLCQALYMVKACICICLNVLAVLCCPAWLVVLEVLHPALLLVHQPCGTVGFATLCVNSAVRHPVRVL